MSDLTGLAAVITALAVLVTSGIGAVAALKSRGDTKTIRKEVTTENGLTSGQTVEAIAKTLEVVQAQGHTNAREVLGVHEKIDRIEDKVDRIDGRVDRVETKADRIDQNLEGHIDEMKVRVLEHDAMVQRLKEQEEGK